MIDILTQLLSLFYSHKFIQSIIANSHMTNHLNWRRGRKIPSRKIQCTIHIRNVMRTTWSWIFLPYCILKKVIKFFINCHSFRPITLCFDWIFIKIVYASQWFKFNLTDSLIVASRKFFIADESFRDDFILTVNSL